MKRWGLVVICLWSFYCRAQQIDLNDLTGMLQMHPGKLESHLQKKGYKRSLFSEDDFNAAAFVKTEKKGSACNTRCFQFNGSEKDYTITYQTTCQEEYKQLSDELKSSGYSVTPSVFDSTRTLYQRQNITIESSLKNSDSTIYYVIRAEKKLLPRKKDILSAEDLLQLDAQEYLIDVFGKENVRQDVFYYTETETNKCSVVFPNTNREAIFVWNDEQNLRGISFILIGGSLHAGQAADNTAAVSHNVWTSRQGIQCGMSLGELEAINKEPIRFYNWHGESAGYLAPHNKGNLDFTHIGMVFNCLNCNYINVSKDDIMNSNLAIQENQKVFLASLIILPGLKENGISRK
jgi:hypothetical protein